MTSISYLQGMYDRYVEEGSCKNKLFIGDKHYASIPYIILDYVLNGNFWISCIRTEGPGADACLPKALLQRLNGNLTRGTIY